MLNCAAFPSSKASQDCVIFTVPHLHTLIAYHGFGQSKATNLSRSKRCQIQYWKHIRQYLDSASVDDNNIFLSDADDTEFEMFANQQL